MIAGGKRWRWYSDEDAITGLSFHDLLIVRDQSVYVTVPANDLLREGRHPFVQVATEFVKAFPSIETVTVRGIAKPMGALAGDSDARSMRYTEATFSENINCTNSLCVHGGFAIGSVLREMAAQGEEHREDMLVCRGHEGRVSKTGGVDRPR